MENNYEKNIPSFITSRMLGELLLGIHYQLCIHKMCMQLLYLNSKQIQLIFIAI